MKSGLLIIFLLSIQFLPIDAFSQNFIDGITEVNTSSGIQTAAFRLKNGTLNINLPADMTTGDTVSGSVSFRFHDLTGDDTVKRFNVNDYRLVIENRLINLTDRNFQFDVPAELPAGVISVTLEEISGNVVSRSFFPVHTVKHKMDERMQPEPADFRIPVSGRSGTPASISGPFDGSYKTTGLRLNGLKARIITESPRTLIFESPDGLSGSSSLVLRERGVNIRRNYMSLNVVKVNDDEYSFVSLLDNNSGLLEKSRRGEFVLTSDDFKRGFNITRTERNKVSHRLPEYNKNKVLNKEESLSGEFIEEEEFDPESQFPESADSSSGSTEDIKQSGEVGPYFSKSKDNERKPYNGEGIGQGINPEESAGKRENESNIHDKYPANGNKQVTSGKYILQLASLKDKSEAYKIIEKLKLKGYNAYSAEADIPGKGTWYRIRIGGFESRDQANYFKSSVDLKGTNLRQEDTYIIKGN